MSSGYSLVQETADSIDEVILSQAPKDLQSRFFSCPQANWLADPPKHPNFIVDQPSVSEDCRGMHRMKSLKHFIQF